MPVPGKPAVILVDTRLSYADLDALSDLVAVNLAAHGFAAGDRVGLQLPNIPEFVIAYFGILKAGGVVVPMNVLLKAPEIEFQLRDSGAVALITFGAAAGKAVKAAEAAAVPSLFFTGPAAEVAAATGGSLERIARWTRAELDAEFAALRNGTLRNMAMELRVKAGSHCVGCAFAPPSNSSRQRSPSRST